MVDTDRLKVLIESSGCTQKKLARYLGISEHAFYRKMRKGVFDSDEIGIMIVLLNIRNPAEIFFARKVTR